MVLFVLCIDIALLFCLLHKINQLTVPALDVPDPPSDMTVTHPAPRELRITWRYDTEANIAARTRFEITITNLNVSGPEGVVEVTDLTEREYTFTADSARQCEVRP